MMSGTVVATEAGAIGDFGGKGASFLHMAG
jgi:hypothetical protein